MPTRKRKSAVKKKSADPNRQISAKVRFSLPYDLVAAYADNLSVTHTDNEFTISFLQVQQPLVDANNPAPDTVEAKCVARVIVAPMRMPQFLAALNANWNRYLETAKDEFLKAQKKIK